MLQEAFHDGLPFFEKALLVEECDPSESSSNKFRLVRGFFLGYSRRIVNCLASVPPVRFRKPLVHRAFL